MRVHRDVELYNTFFNIKKSMLCKIFGDPKRSVRNVPLEPLQRLILDKKQSENSAKISGVE